MIPQVIRSISDSQDEILRNILTLHAPHGFDADLTYGNGGFWRTIPAPKLKFDITPLHPDVTSASSCELPLPAHSIQSAVFDPPFLTYVTGGRAHKGGKVSMTARFGGYYTYGELEAHYRGTLKESARVLASLGVLVFKCQDIIHNHRMHCTHTNVIQWAAEHGFRLRDLFILTAKHRMPGPQKGTQRHARVFHSYFLVLEARRVACPAP